MVCKVMKVCNGSGFLFYLVIIKKNKKMKNVFILIMRQFKVINVDDEICDIWSVSNTDTYSPINEEKKLLK